MDQHIAWRQIGLDGIEYILYSNGDESNNDNMFFAPTYEN